MQLLQRPERPGSTWAVRVVRTISNSSADTVFSMARNLRRGCQHPLHRRAVVAIAF